MNEIVTSAIIYVVKLCTIIGISLFLTEVLRYLGFFEKLSFLLKPISRISNLSIQSSTALLVSFISVSASSAMLRDFYEKKEITEAELFISSCARALPIILMESRYMLPVIVPILGKTGIIYYLIWVGINTTITFAFLLLGKLLLTTPETKNFDIKTEKLSLKKAIKSALKSFQKPFFKISKILIPSVFFTFIFSHLGLFSYFSSKLYFLSRFLPFPSEGLSIVTAYMISPIVAYPIAGELILKGVLSSKDVIICLLSGYVIAFPFHLRSLLPYYVGIYGVKEGFKLMSIAIFSRSFFVLISIEILARL